LGDPLYSEGAARDHERMMLHATELRLRHPDGGRGMRFVSKVPF
jgi:tRNA pseudouridine32 synthase/23S rRNA pseudouridine746 synthase